MLYYKFIYKTKNNYKPEGTREETGAAVNEISNALENLSLSLPNNVHATVAAINTRDVCVVASIGFRYKEAPETVGNLVMEALGFHYDSVLVKEITVKEFASSLKMSERHGFIDDADEILRVVALDHYRSICGKNVHERFILDDIKDVKLPVSESLGYEVERIEDPDAPKTYMGNPVHYILKANEESVLDAMHEILLNALWRNGRLKSKRYSILLPTEDNSNPFIIEDGSEKAVDIDDAAWAFKLQGGGAVVMRPGDINDNGIFADDSDMNLGTLAKIVSDNRMYTLAIVEFTRQQEKAIKFFKEHSSGVRFVEISEDLVFGEKVNDILKDMAKEEGIEDVASLLMAGDTGDGHYVSDLRKFFNEWKDSRLTQELFKSYKSVTPAKILAEKPKGSAIDTLDSLIGLKNVKEVIHDAISFNNAQHLISSRGLKTVNPSRHMVFYGSPGTAKTTVARLFAQTMKDNKILPVGNLIEVGRKDLVGKYVGWTAKCVEDAFNKAKGSVLFIDEAYSLCEEKGGMYGDEAINTIVQMMENCREDTIVIFAGYKDKMDEFLSRNPGLRSRISFHVNFDDYSEEELQDILSLMVKEKGMKLAPECGGKTLGIFAEARKAKDYGNGRFVRNLFEKACMKQASRLSRRLDLSAITDEELMTLEEEDFVMPEEYTSKTERRVVGF